jgi:succinyl-diaminopimelate desuccinylase
MQADHRVLSLTQTLVRENSINPPGDEEACALLLAPMLEVDGFAVKLHRFGDRRVNLVAQIEGYDSAQAPLVLTGHLDTVPLGNAPWAHDPFSGEVDEDRIFGRGVSDMKAGIAAMTIAALDAAGQARLARGLKLIFTGGEETGCEGALALRKAGYLGAASGVVVAEPTANRLSLGHKGCLCIVARATGVTAHSSMPHLGRNAIYRAAEATLAARDFDLSCYPASALGKPTLNVGTFTGGLNFNSVPDAAALTIDMRTTDKIPHDDLLTRLGGALGSDLAMERLVDMPALLTAEDNPFVRVVADALEAVLGTGAGHPRAPMPFFTDGSVMQSTMEAPTVILGPGEPDCAHQTDEWCSIARLQQSVEVYGHIIRTWCV